MSGHGFDGRGLRLAGYMRVSTEEQGSSGLGMAAQEIALRDACAARGWILADLVKEVRSSGKTRPKLAALLGRVEGKESHRFHGVIVAKLDRLTRSVMEFSELLARSEKEGWRLVVLDLGIDTTTPAGRAMAQMVSVFAEFERNVIRQRTRDALAQAKARGQVLGAPVRVSDEATAMVLRLKEDGLSMRAIAGALNEVGLAAPNGGRWAHSTVQRVLGRIAQVAS